MRLAVPIPGEMFKNKVFFFGAQEWVNFFQVETRTNTVPTAAMINGDFSQLLGSNPFFSAPRQIRDPLTGQPFPNNIIPQNRLSPNGVGIMKLYGPPTDGFQNGSLNQLITQRQPAGSAQGQPACRLSIKQQSSADGPLHLLQLGRH